MADELDGTTCTHFSVLTKNFGLSEHKRKLPKVLIRVNTEIDSSNGKIAPQQCLSVKSQSQYKGDSTAVINKLQNT